MKVPQCGKVFPPLVPQPVAERRDQGAAGGDGDAESAGVSNTWPRGAVHQEHATQHREDGEHAKHHLLPQVHQREVCEAGFYCVCIHYIIAGMLM